MTLQYWRGQEATIEASGGSLPTEAVGVLDEPEVAAPEQEVQELRGAGSTKRQDEQKTSTSVTVSGEVAAFDIDTWNRLIDYDDANDELDNSAEVATFTITVTYTAADDSTKEIAVQNAYVDGSVPIGGSREEWIGLSLEFVGDDLVITDTTSA
jgi:hypothetical protein